MGRVCHAVMQVVQVVHHFPTHPHDAAPKATPVVHHDM